MIIFLQQVRLALLGLITFLSIFNLYADKLQINIFDYYICSTKYFHHDDMFFKERYFLYSKVLL